MYLFANFELDSLYNLLLTSFNTYFFALEVYQINYSHELYYNV